MNFEHDWDKYPELTNSELQELYFLSPHTQIMNDFTATVEKIHDGDTISLSTPFRSFVFPLRFLDIDAPELNSGGDVARDWLKSKLEHQEVEIKIDPDNRVEKWGRLLGRVFYRGMDVGQEELYLGLVKPFDQRQEGKIPISDKIFSTKQWF